ncbi:DUF4845 domain-containing protein [Inhella gelatinilytica]|uniref:DUF4845 domain-containing protein n=1 Tax=Inhella gelatinilytica TaxID=2795030 RepID=A0A931NEJ5_9BURK|nr:DUF4845 domain-containing protein [Inhella gelatinilytica]MBH9553295.1 DUF4845 domain-containing protein [Inhella gelatinilytica]
MRNSARAQRGLSLIGMLTVGVIVAFFFIVGAKVTPTLLEYQATKKAVTTIARNNPPTVAAARAEFDRIKAVEYSIQLNSSELDVSKDGDKVHISFAFQREIELGGPVYLLMKYQGQSE